MSNQKRINSAFVLVDACWLVLLRGRPEAVNDQPPDSRERLANDSHRAECARALQKVKIDELLAASVLGLEGPKDETQNPSKNPNAQADDVDTAFA